MATRFGAVSPAQSYQMRRMRWVFGCLAVLVVVIIGALVFIAVNNPTDATVATQVEQPRDLPSTSKIDVLVAAQRIEEGALLQKHYFSSQAWESERLPEGAILYREIDGVAGKYSKGLINANMPILRDQLSDQPPVSALNIPPGFRAVTINVDKRSGVEGFAKPGSRVDVLFKFTDRDGKGKVATIVRFVKVLSVGGESHAGERAPIEGGTTVTLLVTERDARKIELASSVGSLSLSLVGNEERGAQTEDPGIIDIGELIGGVQPEQREEEPIQGRMYMTDPRTGKQRLYVLRNNKWVPEEE